MGLTIFIIFTILYCFTTLRIKQWEVIKTLGFPTETSEGYLKNPAIYNFVRTSFFIIAVITLFLTPYRYSMTIGGTVLGLLWFEINNRGINRGIKEYRRVMKETIEHYEANPDEDGGDFYEHAKNSLNLTDEQIYEMYKGHFQKLYFSRFFGKISKIF